VVRRFQGAARREMRIIMRMRELPKNIKRQLRDLVGRIYELQLDRALGALAGEFEAWKRKEIDAFELEKRVHQFHQGPARELYVQYGSASSLNLELLVAHAVQEQILSKDDIPAEVLPYLENALAFYQEVRMTRASGPDET
jgi:hypothetical protein